MVKFVIERSADRSVAATEVAGETLRIGRGANADLRSENPAISFEHAVVEAHGQGYRIVDQGSVTGTYVNGRPIESAWLNRGDRIDIGDLRMAVLDSDPARPMRMRMLSRGMATDPGTATRRPAASPEKGGALEAPRIDYAASYSLRRPWLTRTAAAGVLVLATLGGGAWVVREENQRAFMPGGLSSAHARARAADGLPIGQRCDLCHTPFRPVADAQCQTCHRQAPHSRLAHAEPACASCHAEHRGQQKLAAMPSSRCTSCHGDLKRVAPASTASSITSFGPSHPDFEYPQDLSALRFNHKLHLRPAGVNDGSGRRAVLECVECHELIAAGGRVDPEPIAFEKHCRDCHRLTFDPRLPRAEVPHGGDAQAVYGFIMAAYAGGDVMSRTPAERRRILAQRAVTPPDERAVLLAEQVVKTKCRHCHPGSTAVPATTFVSAFTHGPHRQASCESCHEAARQSAATADVLLPSRDDCMACHGAGPRQEASGCILCHRYHRERR